MFLAAPFSDIIYSLFFVSDDLLNSSMLNALDAALEKSATSFPCSQRRCSEIGCNAIPKLCAANDIISSEIDECMYQCKCDAVCVYFGDCCYDYWHHCTRSHSITLNRNAPALSNWSKESIESLHFTNNTISSLLKDYIHRNVEVDYKPLSAYASCKPLKIDLIDPESSWDFQVVDKCPLAFRDHQLRMDCEGPHFLTFAPVFLHNVGIFQNKHCVQCHGLSLSQFQPMPLSFTC